MAFRGNVPNLNSISIVVFAKNEEKTIREVLRSLQGKNAEVIVMDGRSSDATPRIAAEEGARVIDDGGRGKGAAQRLAIDAARGDIIVFMDADGSDDAAQFDALVAPIREDRADLVVGSRFAGGSDEMSSSFTHLFTTAGTVLINAAINRRWNVRLTDAMNCFRAIRADVARSLDITENSTAVEHEMVMKCLRRSRRVLNVPTHEYARKHGTPKINPWKAAPYCLIALLRNLW